MMRTFVCFLLISIPGGFVLSQPLAIPDSAAVLKNHVKSSKIFLVNGDERHLTLEIHYDQQGRVVMKRENEDSYYYTFSYDDRNRIITSTQRIRKGELIQKFTDEYDDKTKTKTTRLYFSTDSLNPAYIYTYDRENRKTGETSQPGKPTEIIRRYTYDKNGMLTGTYDSSGTTRTATYRINDLIVQQNFYTLGGDFKRTVRVTYTPQNQISTLTDSSGSSLVYRYRIERGKKPQEITYFCNSMIMDQKEVDHFNQSFPYSAPPRYNDHTEHGLPVPKMVDTHQFTYDKDGNIIRDDLKQTQGSFSKTYVYEYEYVFY